MSVLGNSVGQLSGAVYLPLMVALAGAIPLFIGVVVTFGRWLHLVWGCQGNPVPA